MTRFPPEPNGYLHIGHAEAMRFNFTIARKNGGQCYLRYDDTNPTKEEQEYVDSILADVRWLGFEPENHVYVDYFPLFPWFGLVLIGLWLGNLLYAGSTRRFISSRVSAANGCQP